MFTSALILCDVIDWALVRVQNNFKNKRYERLNGSNKGRRFRSNVQFHLVSVMYTAFQIYGFRKKVVH